MQCYFMHNTLYTVLHNLYIICTLFDTKSMTVLRITTTLIPLLSIKQTCCNSKVIEHFKIKYKSKKINKMRLSFDDL